MSKLSLFACLLTIVGYCNANILPMVGGNAAPATNELHAVVVLAVTDAAAPNLGRMGGGSIISRNRVLTAAHVIEGAAAVRVFFYTGDFSVVANRASATSTFQQVIPKFNSTNRENDLVVLLFAADTFPLANVIAITSETAAPAAAAVATLAGYGFTSADSLGPNAVPLLAPHAVAADCGTTLKVAKSHFCALATGGTFVCPGDNGSGLFTGTGTTRRLVGVLSRMVTRCEASGTSAFTNLADAWVKGFVVSQGVTPGVVPTSSASEEDDESENGDENGNGGTTGEDDAETVEEEDVE